MTIEVAALKLQNNNPVIPCFFCQKMVLIIAVSDRLKQFLYGYLLYFL
ncbi:MAG: hypothetical protein RMX96_27400 [Nostoc sp. ChiSLP02]|nr:hypothetical protein [Nostoc sp. DedSLP05]MDZ8100920.1 hypothetical protein [Nostoc sp. DedSLP01]MDZ8188569.1 hypothetical protein [Nostoc sp. ChiSLP02]